MRTEHISGQNSAPKLLMECGLFQNNTKTDTCSQFSALELETKSFSTTLCNGTTERSSKLELIDKGRDIRDRSSMETSPGLNEENVYVDCDRESITDEDQSTHYAEILTRKPCSTTLSLSRRTRESSNPILQLQYDHESDEGTSIRRREMTQFRDDSSLYENTKNNHTKVHKSVSDSEITYANISHYNREDSHHYENSDSVAASKRRNPSTETSDSESLYEDIGDVYEVMSPRTNTVSQPINIMYASVDFSKSKTTPASSDGSCSFSSSIGSLERSELTRCSSCASMIYPSPSPRKPPELPQRKSIYQRARPSSVHFGNRVDDLTEFGMFTGTLVGSCSVVKSSPKSIQQVVADFLAREKKQHSKPVSLEVNNEFLRLSLNCAPWNLLAQNSVDDIGCVTTVSANNKTALGYTVSKPGESTRCYVIHCSDVDTIKEAILATFKRPDPTLPRWSSMTVLGGGKTRSLPRNAPRHNELAIFDELVYLGSHKVKKSYLVVNDNITTVLDHMDSKTYTMGKVELYKDAIHLKDSVKDRILDIHQLEWILSMGLFDEDRRYFGYISSRALQGSKTRTFCHVFRCNRVGLASRILESIRQACQATFLARTPENEPPYRSRVNSSTSSSSEESISSNSETMSVGSSSSSPTSEQDKAPKTETPERVKRRPRLKNLNRFRSYVKDKRNSDILEEKDEPEIKPKELVYRFNVFYLISTILSPPLKSKHVKNCLKQYQKSVDKEMKRTGNTQHYKKVQLVVNQKGITIVDAASNTPQLCFNRESLSGVQGHPEGKCAFAFTTLVSGNTKHKCHLFLQDKEPMEEIIKVIQSQLD